MSNTKHSREIQEKILNFYLDYPMDSYIPAWKVFRSFTNENNLIADKIISSESWELNSQRNILDVGTGDGSVLKEILSRSATPINFIRVVEPNLELLKEAETNLNSLCLKSSIEFVNSDLITLLNQNLFNINTVILSHVLYLLPELDIEIFFDELPKEVRVYIITDDINSLFPNCWKITSPKYYQRTLNIHSKINSLKYSGFDIKKSSFQTFLQNPFLIERMDIQEKIMSMICYSNFSNLNMKEIELVKLEMKKFEVEDLVYCNSVCYEIIRY
jgi:phospholipid N-methyltransferase